MGKRYVVNRNFCHLHVILKNDGGYVISGYRSNIGYGKGKHLIEQKNRSTMSHTVGVLNKGCV